MEDKEAKKLPCEDCGEENPESHNYCFACGNYLRDDALRLQVLPKSQKALVEAIEQRLRPVRVERRKNVQLFVFGLAYLSVIGAYTAIKMLPALGNIQYIYLTLRLMELGLAVLLAFGMSNRKFRFMTLIYAFGLLVLLLLQNWL